MFSICLGNNILVLKNRTKSWTVHSLPTPDDGSRKGQDNPVIYNNEIQLISQEIKDKLKTLSKIANTIEKIEEEESQIRDDVNQMILESEKEHGALAQRLVNIDDLYNLLAELERDLMDLRRHGNITPHERRTWFAEPEATPKDRIESVIAEL